MEGFAAQICGCTILRVQHPQGAASSGCTILRTKQLCIFVWNSVYYLYVCFKYIIFHVRNVHLLCHCARNMVIRLCVPHVSAKPTVTHCSSDHEKQLLIMHTYTHINKGKYRNHQLVVIWHSTAPPPGKLRNGKGWLASPPLPTAEALKKEFLFHL